MAERTVRRSPEFKRLMDLVRSRRSPSSLAKEFGPSAWANALWVKQGASDAGGSGQVFQNSIRLLFENQAQLHHTLLQASISGPEAFRKAFQAISNGAAPRPEI